MFRKKKTEEVPTDQLVWINSSDRGRAVFFHGRDQELSDFAAALEEAQVLKGGTIFLVQGPPGAGKTAFLHECRARIKSSELTWHAVRITSKMLHNPAALAKRLDVSYATRTSERKDTTTNVGVSVGFGTSVKHTKGISAETTGDDIEDVLREASLARGGLVIVLDEAQNIVGEIGAGSPEWLTAQRCLNQIHNGEIGAPVVLLAGGLGTTEGVFGTFGISRFPDDALHLLGALDNESARSVIRDWLVKSGGAPASHEYLGQWIDTLASECFGWAQHIQRYAFVAAKWLLKNGHMPTSQVPPEVLSEGRWRREKYYLGRARGTIEQDRVSLANLLHRKGNDCTLSREDLVQTLLENRTREQAEEKFDHLLYKGMVAETPRGGYIVPIPSMQDWLIREYATAAR